MSHYHNGKVLLRFPCIHSQPQQATALSTKHYNQLLSLVLSLLLETVNYVPCSMGPTSHTSAGDSNDKASSDEQPLRSITNSLEPSKVQSDKKRDSQDKEENQ